MEQKRFDDYFGVDLGDGESAVAWLRAGSKTEPQMVEIRGRKSVITAVGVKDGETLIGEEACHASGLTALNARFKRLFLTDPDKSEPWLKRFAQALVNDLAEAGRMADPERAMFLVGCPSGWNEATRARYRALLETAGMRHVAVASESRAAFLFARESGELRAGDDLITLPTLIVDAGSSTVDFTYVCNLKERALASDFGDVSLGGGLLDKLLLERNVSRSPERDKIERIFARFPQYEARCELEARRVKELFFVNQQRGGGMPSASGVKLYADAKPVTLDIDCSERDMLALLSCPIDTLSGRTFRGAFQAALRGAAESLSPEKPETVLLTGGASRMPFIESDVREAFPDAVILKGLEPEFAIARGLCYALRVDGRIDGFLGEVRALDAALEDVVRECLPELYASLSERVADELIGEIAPASFERWRAGGVRTVEEMGEDIGARMKAAFDSGELPQRLRPAVREWVESLRPAVEALTDPICDQYELTRASLHMSENLPLAPAELTLRGDQLMRLDAVKLTLDLVIASVSAVIVGGGGVALIAGPLGLVAGFAAGLVAGVAGTEIAGRALSKANLPLPMRKLVTARRFQKGLTAKRGELAGELYAQMNDALEADGASAMTKALADAIESQLADVASRAALMIH